MKIISGLFPHGVLQRNKRGLSDTWVTGQSPQAGELFWRGSSRSWKKAGRVRRGRFRFQLAGLPTGGPYRIELEIRAGRKAVDRLDVADVLVGDVWLCGGQSNMQGCGHIYKAIPPRARVRAFYMDDCWAVAKDPIHNIWDCVDEAHINICGGIRPTQNPKSGTGPAVAFGQEMLADTGVPQGLIACAHGGTSMAQWNPLPRKGRIGRLFGAACRRLEVNGGKIAGIIWYQGESDANPAAAAIYTTAMKNLIAAFRREAGDRRLPFALVQLGRLVTDPDPVSWNSIQDQQRLLSKRIPNVTVVPAVDLKLEDTIHIEGRDLHRLGRRLAEAVQALGRRGHKKPPITLRSVSIVPSSFTDAYDIMVEFDHVEGNLISEGRPSGFTLANPAPMGAVFNVTLKKDRALLHTAFLASDLGGLSVYHGRGSNPYCNIRDEADRSLPVFGPVPIPHSQAITPFFRQWKTAQSHRLGWRDLSAPFRGLSWSKDDYPDAFCEQLKRLQAEPRKPKAVLFRGVLNAPEKMRLAMVVGYHRAFKIWVDGKLLWKDASPPRLPSTEQRKIPLRIARGRHEIVVALDTSVHLQAGFFFRLQRLDLAPRLIARGPSHYAMPRMSST